MKNKDPRIIRLSVDDGVLSHIFEISCYVHCHEDARCLGPASATSHESGGRGGQVLSSPGHNIIPLTHCFHNHFHNSNGCLHEILHRRSCYVCK